MNDPKIIEATRDMVRVIIRRPHAYKFKREHPNAGIPCLAIVNGDEKFLGGVTLPQENAVSELVDRIAKQKAELKRSSGNKRAVR